MRTRRISVFALAVVAVVAAVAAPALAADNLAIDGVHSTVMFKIKHVGTSNFYGRFNDVSGKVAWDPAGEGVSVDVKVKADSIDTNNAKRDQHLKSADFFNTGQFPVIAFKSKSAKKTGDKTYELTGTLDLHGVKKEITVAFEVVGEAEGKVGAEAKFTIKRSEYGMSYMPDGLGEEVEILVSLEAGKK